MQKSLRFITPFTMLVVVSGCGPQTDAPVAERSLGATVFNAAEIEAASALSMGNSGTISGGDTPFHEALICSDALAEVVDNLQNDGSGLSDRLTVILRARDYFAQRATTLSREDGLSAGQLEAEQQAVANRPVLFSEKAQLSIKCLRDLAETSPKALGL